MLCDASLTCEELLRKIVFGASMPALLLIRILSGVAMLNELPKLLAPWRTRDDCCKVELEYYTMKRNPVLVSSIPGVGTLKVFPDDVTYDECKGGETELTTWIMLDVGTDSEIVKATESRLTRLLGSRATALWVGESITPNIVKLKLEPDKPVPLKPLLDLIGPGGEVYLKIECERRGEVFAPVSARLTIVKERDGWLSLNGRIVRHATNSPRVERLEIRVSAIHERDRDYSITVGYASLRATLVQPFAVINGMLCRL